MDDSTLSERLEQFGLSEKEIDTYLSILRSGEAKASEIADDTGVSTRYVYSISEELEQRGFVEVNDHAVPTTIRARPPDEVISTLEAQLADIQPALDDRFSATAARKQEFEVIKSRATVIKRIREYVADADGEVTLTVPYEHVSEVADELEAAVDRGVMVLLVVVDIPDHSEARLRDLVGLGSVVRTSRQPSPIMLTGDQEYGLVSPAEMVTHSNSDAQAIAFVQPQIVPVIVGSFLGNYWPMADEHHVAEPAPLSRTYDNFRHAVLDATLRLRNDERFVATATARPIDEDDPEQTELSGIVLDTRQALVRPQSNSFPIEHSLVLDVGETPTTVGGRGSFLEDYEADSVTFEPV